MSILRPNSQTPYVSPRERPRLIRTNPDGSTCWAIWRYEYNPTEGWVEHEWTEPAPEALEEKDDDN